MSVQLPQTYEKRYVVAWTVAMLPLAGVLLAFVWTARPTMLLAESLLTVAYVVTLVLVLRSSASRSRSVLETCGFVPAKRLRIDLSLPAAILFVGGINAIFKGDWRWILVAAWLGAVLACGLALRWLILDRWLQGQMEASSL